MHRSIYSTSAEETTVRHAKCDKACGFALLSIFAVLSIGLLYASIFVISPGIYGDGHEYLAITVSLYNHMSPDLQSQDVVYRNAIEAKNDINFGSELDHSDYAGSPVNGKLYPFHFWFYSLLNIPAFYLLQLFHGNELRCFQITNSVLLLSALAVVVFQSSFNNWKKLLFFSLAAFNLILLYIPWSHPEVFTYSLVLASAVYMLENRPYLAILLSSLASLQNPPVSVLTLFYVLYGWKQKAWDLRSLFAMLAVSSISAAQYLFYYAYFHTFSVITMTGLASTKLITIEKALSLFIDPNFGILPYFSVLTIACIAVLIACLLKKDLAVPALWLVLALMAVVCSTQINWNSGMMYLNRYATYFLPILFAIVFLGYKFLPHKVLDVILLTSILTTGTITGVFLFSYDNSSYVRFNDLSSNILLYAPGIYNPPNEVFAERALGMEVDYTKYYPIVYPDREHPRKILTDYSHIPDVEILINRTLSNQEKDAILRAGSGYINN